MKRYTCSLDNFTIDSPNDQDMWDHIDAKHSGVNPNNFWTKNIRVAIIPVSGR